MSIASPIHTYFDDSGCNPNKSRTFIWAGYAATLLFWRDFGEAWNRILDRSPRIEYWHQTDVRAKNRSTDPKNPFCAYEERVLRRRELSLCRLVYKCRKAMWAFAAHIRHSDHKKYVAGRINNPAWTKEHRDFIRPDLMESPHLIALMYSMRRSDLLHSKEPKHRMPVSFHCESQKDNPYQDHMLRIWKVLREKHPEDLGTLDFPLAAR
jgi:hypothetical protein